MSKDLFSRIQGFGRRFNSIVGKSTLPRPLLLTEDDYTGSIRPVEHRSRFEAEPDDSGPGEGMPDFFRGRR